MRAHLYAADRVENLQSESNRGVNIAVSYAIGRRIGNAVVRNRIKRRLRAAFSQHRELPDGYYLVGVHNADIAKIDFAKIGHNLDVLAQKIGRSIK